MADVAEAAGLDRGEAETMLAGGEGSEEVARELIRGRRLGVSGVPTFVIGGEPLVSGAAPPERLASAIADAAQTIA